MGKSKPVLEMIDLIGNLLYIFLSIYFIYYLLTNEIEFQYLAIVPCFFFIQGILGLVAWKRRKEA
ncbi:hypothetical protein [Planococcus wigleyi]|uniref:Uncharacterized protein n=1 Tax=Planococcus wigleyi TaxID=2762216 RepID=A0ABR8WEM1_9BACL|nr:hypothetical protein [Planococcus wigleyi]MBD8015488.1 hypothetical protein [Planococcus wigleyi]